MRYSKKKDAFVDRADLSVVKSKNLITGGTENMSEEQRKYYESEAKRKWQKENTVMIPVKLQKSTDHELIAFLEGKQKQTIIKKALHEYIVNHPDEAEENDDA